MEQLPDPTYRSILGIAWPLILANAAVPILGLVDTAVIGRGGTVSELGAIAFGSLIFSFVYWGFGFLRMGTTGFVAQAQGARNEPEVRATFTRAGVLAGVFGVLLLLLGRPIIWIALKLLSAGEGVETLAGEYFRVRIFGAPATLTSFVIAGVLIGLGETRLLLWVQLLLNGLNIVLDLIFAGVMGWGVRGVAIGTVIAEWTAVGFGIYVIVRLLKARHSDDQPFIPLALVRSGSLIKATLTAHRDLMIRTILLVFSFAWFTQQSAKFGDGTLAANHVLLQFITFASFFLDGIAFSAESLVGTSAGAKDLDRFNVSVRRSNRIAFGIALALAAFLAAFGSAFIRGLTDIVEVRLLATDLLVFPVIYIVVAVWAFQYDGIFIGVTRSREMRNASVVSTAAFLAIAWPMISRFGNQGLWLAFIAYAAVRSLALLSYMPQVRAGIRADSKEQGVERV